jgi:hypothetical protein
METEYNRLATIPPYIIMISVCFSYEIVRHVSLFYDRFLQFLKLRDFNMTYLITVIQLTVHSNINLRSDCSKFWLPIAAFSALSVA